MTWLLVLAAVNAAAWLLVGLAARRDQTGEHRILARMDVGRAGSDG